MNPRDEVGAAVAGARDTLLRLAPGWAPGLLYVRVRELLEAGKDVPDADRYATLVQAAAMLLLAAERTLLGRR